jgi:hypothetical protein
LFLAVGKNNRPIIVLNLRNNVENVAITGNGIIDGEEVVLTKWKSLEKKISFF